MPTQQPVTEAARLFLAHPTNKPGCYNDPTFTALEKRDARVLEEYAKYVLSRPRTFEEDERTRAIVAKLVATFSAHVSDAELLGRCGEITNSLVKMLEQAGVWCFAVRGSVRFIFDDNNLKDRFFWSRDRADFVNGLTGHVWVVAPPFAIIDFTARAQRWQDGEEEHVPRLVAVEHTTAGNADPDLFGPPEGGPWRVHPEHRELLGWLPTRRVRCEKATIVYQPDGVNLPLEPTLEEFRVTLGGRPVAAFWKEVVEPALSVA